MTLLPFQAGTGFLEVQVVHSSWGFGSLCMRSIASPASNPRIGSDSPRSAVSGWRWVLPDACIQGRSTRKSRLKFWGPVRSEPGQVAATGACKAARICGSDGAAGSPLSAGRRDGARRVWPGPRRRMASAGVGEWCGPGLGGALDGWLTYRGRTPTQNTTMQSSTSAGSSPSGSPANTDARHRGIRPPPRRQRR